MREIRTALLMLGIAVLLPGCDPVTVHKITSTIFDGVPSLPPAEQYCMDFHEQKMAEEENKANAGQQDAAAVKLSRHLPYAQKKCNDCHDKTTESGLIRPPKQLCFVCHPNILAGAYVHGPAAVGDCLACHDPHSAGEVALLKVEKTAICVHCHKEKRIAETMHQRLAEKGMLCMECHDPHAGNSMYFLK